MGSNFTHVLKEVRINLLENILRYDGKQTSSAYIQNLMAMIKNKHTNVHVNF